jgi:hypothetical protein
METASVYKSLVLNYQSTRRHISECHKINIYLILFYYLFAAKSTVRAGVFVEVQPPSFLTYDNCVTPWPGSGTSRTESNRAVARKGCGRAVGHYNDVANARGRCVIFGRNWGPEIYALA